MKLLIMSDTHRLTKEISTIKERHEFDFLIHCGDSELDESASELKDVQVVKGNCDHGSQFSEEKIIELHNGIICYITHGHLYDVKRSLEKLSYRAEEHGADFCFFGHTHIAGVVTINETVYINPGSLMSPRNRKEKTYVLLELEDGTYHLTFYNLKGHVVEENLLTY